MTFWNFLKQVHSGSEEGSAKRVYGGLIIIAMLTILFFTGHKIVPLEVWNAIEGTYQYVFTIGATLLGLNTIIDIYKIVKDKKNGPESKPPVQP